MTVAQTTDSNDNETPAVTEATDPDPIVIGGNVYGGGNKGHVDGSTSVTVKAGNLQKVFGGARQANVGGSSYVHIDGKEATNYMLINYVFGGNDIAGQIGSKEAQNATLNEDFEIPMALPAEIAGNKDGVDLSWNSYVHLSTKIKTPAIPYTQEECDTYNTSYGYVAGDANFRTTDDIKTPAVPADDNRKVFIGQTYAGGNGGYDYDPVTNEDTDETTAYNVYQKPRQTGDKPIATIAADASMPNLAKAYLDVQGGTIDYAYGGGNNATVTEKTVIHIDNPSEVVTNIYTDKDSVEDKTVTDELFKANPENYTGIKTLLTDERIKAMGINAFFSSIESASFQMGRLFGGNNTAEMAIMPTWNLQNGRVRNLYSGGNKGTMTSPKGILLEIPAASHIVVDNLYGGCRMANVVPKNERGDTVTVENLEGYKFPKGLSARVLVRGGDVNNVYGGNDVTGTVFGGNAVGIYTSIRGDVYGGGNGAYPYTNLVDNETLGDLFYGQDASVEELNAFRPNAEQVSIRLAGKAKKTGGQPDYTIIKGGVYVGGNCATLTTKKSTPLVELKMGSYVIADKLFLGNNGEGMIDEDNLKLYAGYVDSDGKLTEDDQAIKFSTMNLTNGTTFADYMEGVTMTLQPAIVFDKMPDDPEDYVNYSSYVGSFYCGGNVGSMAIPGTNTYQVSQGLNIFEKFVGGCNNADVPAREGLNATYKGGVLGTSAERYEDDKGYTMFYDLENGKKNIRDRLVINLDNLVITPLRWNDTFTRVTQKKLAAGKTYYTDDAGTYSFVSNGTEEVDESVTYYEKKGDTYVQVPSKKLTEGREYYYTDLRSSKFIADGTEVFDATGEDKKKTYYELTQEGYAPIWNTVKWDKDKVDFMSVENNAVDDDTRLLGGNVYGGCYSSGHVNGNVVININEDVLQKENVFGSKIGTNGRKASGVELENQRDDLLALALTVFGAGCGKETEIWGSTTVNLNKGYAFQIFGGGEEGVVGKKVGVKDNAGNIVSEVYEYDPSYSSTVNMKGQYAGYSEDETGNPLAETEYIYGGGNEGDVCGNTRVNLGNGRVSGVFGGASNADILGGAEVFIGYNDGFPWVTDNVYGGNDFGGSIKGSINHSDIVKSSWTTSPDALLMNSSTYVKYIQGRTDSIFGGCYGSYDYTDRAFSQYTDEEGKPLVVNGKPVFNFPHLDDNSFVHFTPADKAGNHTNHIFGGSEGYPGDVDMNDAMQRESYVLIDDSETKDADRFAAIDIYGGGAFAGVGIPDSLGAGRTRVDLYAGTFHNVYGGSNQEGLIGLTQVNVPTESSVKVNAIFGGSKGYDPALFTETPTLSTRYCDNYITCVDFKGKNAIVNDGIYGGNENSRISCDTYINIEAPVLQSNGYQGYVYGAGYGRNTVSGRTNIFMNNGGVAYKVFGGGRDGNAFNFASLKQWLANQFAVNHPIAENATQEQTAAAVADITKDVKAYGEILTRFGDYITRHKVRLPSNTGTYANASGDYDGTYTNDIMPTQEKPMPDYHQTNVHLMKGSTVTGYAYGGGFGSDAIVGGTTFVELKGGTVDRDIYGGGQGGQVYDEFGLAKDADATNDFVAATNVYIEGGMARNVYGGGYLGHVGKHDSDGKGSNDGDGDSFSDVFGPDTYDIPAVANITIGKAGTTDFYTGNPAIQRNVYGGGEGGSVFGKANVTINNGMVGYRYKNTGTEQKPVYEYVEELLDGDRSIDLAGNVFGGGYVVNSYVDSTDVKMYGGTVRGSLFGGGEVGPIGRGTMKTNAPETGGKKQGPNNVATIYKAGKTHVEMYDGHVLRNVFGGGRGKDSWGGDGTMYMLQNMSQAEFDNLDFDCKGFVFGQTEVYIHGGEIGTEEGLAKDYGNVFGGCDEGSVYSAYEENKQLCISTKAGERYNEGLSPTDPGYNYQGYYYKHDGTNFVTQNEGERVYTEDCKVVVEPWLQVKKTAGITFDADGDGTAETYAKDDYIPTAYLNTLPAKAKDATNWPTEWDGVDVGKEVTTGGKTVFNERGIHIHNAVFAGGNTATGSSTVHAKAKTVFGNVSASIHDVYNRDFITIGTNGIGGLYGDGNLTFVDGYRELNITNYGTDYYHLQESLPYEKYDLLPDREKAYYEVKYKCVLECIDFEGTKYLEEATLPKDELIALFTNSEGNSVMAGNDSILVTQNGKKVPNSKYWLENGVVSTYAGRYMNTIQRADFCGVYGSRMVMKGAPDRVPEKIDYTNYTINRVREVSLNKKKYREKDPETTTEYHGNYFGIYNIVHYLGALTSDVRFNATANKDGTTNKPEDVRTTEADDMHGDNYGTTTFHQWKAAHSTERSRNNGSCHNKLALASGVYLELTTEESTGDKLTEKVWGPITGVVELDLINVQPGIGGGFVYAKNIHGVPKATGHVNTTMTALNQGAATKWDYDYLETNPGGTGVSTEQKKYETSGNFINSSVSQPIIDDCYNASGRYEMNEDGTDKNGRVPAHYWFIQGQVYVYDQYISAYTGSPNAYSETVELPITLAAASNGKMTLMDVQPNLYAYYTVNNTSEQKPLTADSKIVVNDVEYKLNDPISYWDWYLLPASTQNLFVEKTYVTTKKCQMTINGEDVIIPADTVLLPAEYDNLLSKAVMKDVTPNDGINNEVPAVVKVIEDEEGNISVEKDEDGYDVYQAFDNVFHESNNMRHDTGYLLTYKVTNPGLWDQWYTKIKNDTLKNENNQVVTDAQGHPIFVRVMQQTEDGTVPAGYEDGPTYHAKEDGLYGQQEYKLTDIITEDVYQTYERLTNKPTTGQAVFERAYVTKEYVEATDLAQTEQHMQKGTKLAKSEYSENVWNTLTSKVEEAYVCTSTIEISSDSILYPGDLITKSQKEYYSNKLSTEDNKLIVPAYYCTTAGYYGGDYYTTNENHRAHDIWSSMSADDRNYFEYNYDALDLLIDPNYGKKTDGTRQKEGQKYQYDGEEDGVGFTTKEQAALNPPTYSLKTPIDYTATYDGNETYTVDDVTHYGFEYEDKQGNTHSCDKGTELTREQYEALPNEQRYYVPIEVEHAEGQETTPKDCYVVKETFIHSGGTLYAVGTVLSKEKYDQLTQSEQNAYITTLKFEPSDIGKTYYYCREDYEVNEKGEGHTPTPVAIGDYFVDIKTTQGKDSVKVGTIINEYNTGEGSTTYYGYNGLPNRQLDFVIHGTSPMETSTLYVTRNSNIEDLSKEKIITVIYQYDYDESDTSGKHFTPISERHIVKIHITFKAGIPIVDDIHAPSIVLPGTSVTMSTPKVTSGGPVVTGGGWELFERKQYAESHINGMEYTPNKDPLYWYQDGYLIAYYATTSLGKTYSNAVPVSVANYHDLKKVMDDKKNHLHVDYDRTRLKRDAKIYINDYGQTSDTNKDGLDLFKDLYDLSLLHTGAPSDSYAVTTDNDGLINSGNFIGHKPLNISTTTGTNTFDGQQYTKGMKAGTNLDFFLRTDIDHTAPSGSPAWTPIASGSNPCFMGTLHGDGHTISGLTPAANTTGSLFGRLCGRVYNLGVTGSFTGAGVVDEGEGYVESCWVKTTATPAAGTQAVFGNPSRTGDTDLVQVVNCYYPESNNDYTVPTDNSHGAARKMPDKAFYDGELAYDLNNFYLYKRYYNKRGSVDPDVKEEKKNFYFTIGDDDQLTLQPYRIYGVNPTLCSSGLTIDNKTYNYVEDRFADGDFRFADGSLTVDNERYYEWEVLDEKNLSQTKSGWFPIWPDDYIFFGQKLTFGHSKTDAHQEVPTAVAKLNGRLSQTTDANRVYRAPAYYRSKVMGVAHFNPTAYLAQKEKLTDEQLAANATNEEGNHPELVITPRDAYPNMTAIDFAGHNGTNETNGAYELGGTKWFYPPLLDDDGLQSITNCDETKNLLVYAPAEESENGGYANAKTYTVLNGYFTEPVFNEYYDRTNDANKFTDGEVYDRVSDAMGQNVVGHVVQSSLTATNDHLLVDKQDFNAPIQYSFASGNRMWYQRLPGDNEFVNRTKGWQGISIPFKAELVTTHQKGEITHFYSGSKTSANTDKKIGHEYWLRQYTGINEANGANGANVATANFTYPDAVGSDAKTVTNTFLWDYYYSKGATAAGNAGPDENTDIYQKYYSEKRRNDSYPELTAATPYLLGLPGQTYYEFDLSGNFTPQHTGVAIDQVQKQVITFASHNGTTIEVSDDQIAAMLSSGNATRPVHGNYAFVPTFMNDTLKAVQVDASGNRVSGDTTPMTFAINDTGDAYNAVTWTKNGNGNENENGNENDNVVVVAAFRPYFLDETPIGNARRQTRSIVFSNVSGDSFDPDASGNSEGGSLSIASGRKKIMVTSNLKETATVQIRTTAGVTVATFDIQPGETVETRVALSGVFIVQTTDGQHTKKLSVK